MMSNAEKKKWLNEYKSMEIEYERLEQDRERILVRMENLGAQVIDGMPRAQSGRSDRLVELIDKLSKLEDIMNKRLVDIIDKKHAIYRAINSIEGSTERIVLEYRYLDGLSWGEIAEKMGYCERQVQRVHDRAIDKISI